MFAALQRHYSARDLAAIGVAKADFCLLTVHDRVLLYSADETAVRVEEVDLATGAKVATSNIDLPGRMRYFTRQLNYLGDFNYLTGWPLEIARWRIFRIEKGTF